MPLGELRIDKGKTPCFISFVEIDLHPHQKHEMAFFDQHRDSGYFELLIFRFGFVKPQGIGHPPTTPTLYTHSKVVVRGYILGGHDVFDLSFRFFCDLDRSNHEFEIKLAGNWFGDIPNLHTAGFSGRDKLCKFEFNPQEWTISLIY